MTQIDFILERHGDSYHATRWQGEPKFLGHGDDSSTFVKEIKGSIRPDSDEDNARIWHAADHVFDSVRSYAWRKIGANPADRFIGDPPNRLWLGVVASVQVERYPDPDDGHDQVVVRSSLPMFADDGTDSDAVNIELRYDLAARKPDIETCEALIVLADWMSEETIRQMGNAPTS